MTFYKFVTTASDSRIDTDSLEYVAVQCKRKKNEIDGLSIAYERANDALASIIERQKAASEDYKELKKKLIKLAEEIETKDE